MGIVSDKADLICLHVGRVHGKTNNAACSYPFISLFIVFESLNNL